MTKNYRHVVVDSPAGLEHLNRRITSEVDDIFDIIDPSKKSFNHVKRAYRIAKEVKINFKHFYVIGGYRFPEELGAEVEKERIWNIWAESPMTETLKTISYLEGPYSNCQLHPQHIVR